MLNKSEKTALIVVCGATATGKSALGLELAQRLNSMIISADSRQVYREFDIGTAKPSQFEQSSVPHHLIDICDPKKTLTLAQYQEKAQFLINNSPVLNPLLIGGTGLYIKSIVKGLKIPKVAPQNNLRLQLQTLGQQQCYKILTQVDEIAADKIHPNDVVRTLRALEVYYVTGISISQQQGENPPTYPILQIGLDCLPEDLQKRIEQRTEKMIEIGLVKEVEYLIKKYSWDLPLLNTLGYSEIKDYLQNELSLEKTKESIILHTRQFAKRQRTWFRADPDIKWFDITSPNILEKVWQTIQKFIDELPTVV